MSEPTSVAVRAPYIDDHGTVRYSSLLTLPYPAVLCLANGHAWNDPPDQDGTSHFRCDHGCTREKVEHQDITGAVTREYSGGHLLAPEARVPRNEARAELRRRKRRLAQQSQEHADAAADLEMRAAVEEHRAVFRAAQ